MFFNVLHLLSTQAWGQIDLDPNPKASIRTTLYILFNITETDLPIK